MPVLLGTSGWQYKSWKSAFYRNEKQTLWLERYAESFATVEVNNAFYRLPERTTFEAWAERTPGDFVVGVKMSRYLTHIKRLKEPEEPVARFLDRAAGLGKKLGPVLLQLPPNLQANTDALATTLALFPSHIRVCVEFRHPTLYFAETRSILEKYNSAVCLYDSTVRSGTDARGGPLWRTADWGYVRFHDGAGEPSPCYQDNELQRWTDEICQLWGPDEDLYAYFNNDPNVCAVRDAGLFGQMVRDNGRQCTRFPDPSTIEVTR